MASAFTHAFIAITIGKSFQGNPKPTRFWVLSILCSILPDVDVIGFAFGIDYGDFLGHRGFTHSLVFAFTLSVIVVRLAFAQVVGFSKSWWRLVLYFFLVTASHGVLDAMTNGGLGIAFFAPFNNTRFFLPWTPLKVPPIGITNFFTENGLKVLESELRWIWIPVSLLIVGAIIFRRMTAS